MKSYLTANALARRLNVCPATLANRIRARIILPDAVLIQGQRKAEALLFDTERLPELRQLPRLGTAAYDPVWHWRGGHRGCPTGSEGGDSASIRRGIRFIPLGEW